MMSSPSPAPVGTRGDRTRRAILDAARTRFAAGGFADTTLADVAADAAVSGPTVAFHFGGKPGLLAAVVRDYYDGLIERLDVAIDAPASPTARLTAFVRFWLAAIDGDMALFGVFAAHGWLRETGSPPGVAVREGNAQITRRLDRIVDDLKADGTLRAEVPTRLVRDAVFGTAEHVLRAQARTRRPLDHRRAADRILDLVLHGAAGPPPAADPGRLERVEAKLDALLARGS